LISSISISKISFIIFPADAVNPADKAARKIFDVRRIPGEQIIADTITDAKVIRKLIGRVIKNRDFSFSFKSNS
jgi:hypothetical protein